MSLQAAREKADMLEVAFEKQCVISGYRDKWDAYKKHEAGEKWPDNLEMIWQWYITATIDFYEMRDGPNGFLGKYGI